LNGSLPESIGDLSNLRKLKFSNVWFDQLPETIGRLTSLKEIHFLGSSILTLPESFGNLGGLESLCIKYNGPGNGNFRHINLPESFGNLRSLKILDIYNYAIKSFPYSFGNLPSLERLYMWSCLFMEIPESFCKLSSLEEFGFSSDDIVRLPSFWGCLKGLKILEIYLASALKELPESIGGCTALESLRINFVPISTLPESFGDLISLKELILSGTKLQSLPQSFGNLKSLESLEIYGGELEALPESFGNLNALEELKITRSKLITLPESFEKFSSALGKLTTLKKLTLETIPWRMQVSQASYNDSDSDCICLPESFGNFYGLKELALSGIYPGENAIGNIKTLQKLQIWVDIEEIPSCIENLTSLYHLEISSWKLRKIPDFIGNMRNLRYLSFENCVQIEKLPELKK
jgi:Leucine-rich repeat (LRR) protein